MAITKPHTFLRAGVPYRVGPSPNDLRTFSPDELRAYCDNTRRMISSGMRVPVLSEHAPPGAEEGGPVATFSEWKERKLQFGDALKTAGWVADVRFNEATGEAQAFYDITAKPYQRAIEEKSILFTSPELRPEYVDGLRRTWHDDKGGIFAHFALTPKPRNPAQGELMFSDDPAKRVLQFSVAHEVGFTADKVPVLQFVGSDLDVARNYPSRGMRRGAVASRKPRQSVSAAGMAEGNDADSVARGTIQPLSNAVTNIWGANPPEGISGGTVLAKSKYPGAKKESDYGPGNYGTRPSKEYTGRRFPRTPGAPKQFAFPLQDAGMGFPGPVPSSGPFDSGNAGLEAALEQNPAAGIASPPQNPDVIQSVDEGKRQQSEAILQLLAQYGLPLPVGCDFTPLGDGTIHALLASLKTAIEADNRHEEDMAVQAQDQQLKEQVPMAAQMGEDEDVQFRDETWHGKEGAVGYQTPAGRAAGASQSRKRFWQGRRKKLPRAKRAHEARVEASDDEHKYPKPPKPKTDHSFPRPKGKKKEEQMSEDADRRVIRQVAAQKARMDHNQRHAIGQYVFNSPLPPGIKAKLIARVEGMQFSDDGQAQPSFTMTEVVNLLTQCVPRQFQDDELVEGVHPQQQAINAGRDANNARLSAGMDRGQHQFAEGMIDGKPASAYYDEKFAGTTWSKLRAPATNGHAH